MEHVQKSLPKHKRVTVFSKSNTRFSSVSIYSVYVWCLLNICSVSIYLRTSGCNMLKLTHPCRHKDTTFYTFLSGFYKEDANFIRKNQFDCIFSKTKTRRNNSAELLPELVSPYNTDVFTFNGSFWEKHPPCHLVLSVVILNCIYNILVYFHPRRSPDVDN